MPKHEKRISLRSIPPEVKYKIASYLHLSSSHTQISLISNRDKGLERAIEAAKWDQFNPSYFILDQDIFDEFIREGHKHTRCLELDHTSAITSEVQGLYLPKLRSIRIFPGFTQYEELALLTEKNPQIMCLELCNESYIEWQKSISEFTNEPILASMATPSLSVLRIDQELDHISLGLILSHFTNLHDITFFFTQESLNCLFKNGARELSVLSNIQYITSDGGFLEFYIRSIFSNSKNFPKLESILIKDKDHHELVPLFNKTHLGPNYVSKPLERLLSDENLALVNPEVYQAHWILKHRENSRKLNVELCLYNIASSEYLEALSILATGLRSLEYISIDCFKKVDSKRLLDAILNSNYNLQQDNLNQCDTESIPKKPIIQNHLPNLNILILAGITLTLSDFTLFNQYPKLSNICSRYLDINELPFILSEGIVFPYIKKLEVQFSFNLSNDFIQVLSLFPCLIDFVHNKFIEKFKFAISKLEKNSSMNALRSIVLHDISLSMSDIYQISTIYDKLQVMRIHSVEYDEKVEKSFRKDTSTTTTMMFPYLKTLDVDGLKEFKTVKDTIKLLDTFPALEVFKFCGNYFGGVDSLRHVVAVEIGYAMKANASNAIRPFRTKSFSFSRFLRSQFKHDPVLIYKLKNLVSKEMFDYYDLEAIDDQVQDELFSVY
ncbi:hypothetical protein H4219_004166 [Mycoemilia scoparia]|uniref:Uncharacterized protein n=1 Tax=Mycoemilia scoparia TaxID=417184 RepID=A0A9W8DSA1_9FUNG|nr:hypothetical protein H4219_004166 [Mycoemilia scoparia]